MSGRASRTDEARLAAQAAEWITVIGEQPQRRAAFFEWLRASPRHVEETLFVLALFRQAAMLDKAQSDALLADIDGLAGPGTADIVALDAAAPALPPARPRRFGRRWKWGGVLAAGLLLALAGWIWSAAVDVQEYSTRIGEQRSFTLQDGSLVQLNTRSRLQVRLAGRERQLRLLEGEALFAVKEDATRPFTVTTQDAAIEVLGTQFNVYRRAGDTQVAVLEGLVRVAGARVPAGEQVEVIQGRISVRGALDLTRVMAWRQRRLVFENDTLYYIAAQFNRYNTQLSIRVAPGLEEQRFTGTFDADQPDTFVSALAANRQLAVERGGDEIIVRRR